MAIYPGQNLKGFRGPLISLAAHLSFAGGMTFIATNSSATEQIDSYESTKPKKPNFFALVALTTTSQPDTIVCTSLTTYLKTLE